MPIAPLLILALGLTVGSSPSLAAERYEAIASARDLSGPAAVAALDDGRVFVVEAMDGRLTELHDRDGDGRFEARTVRLTRLAGLNGVAAAEGGLWLSARNRLLWWGIRAEAPEEVADGLPPAAALARALALGPDGRLYVSADEVLARFDPRDGDLGVYARGLRAVTGFGWHPATLGFWGVDRGQPGSAPGELNRLVIANDYGWPGCPGAAADARCRGTTAAALEFPHHPMAMAFVPAGPHAGDAIVAAEDAGGATRLYRVDFDPRGAPGAVMPVVEDPPWEGISGLAAMPDGSVLVAAPESGVLWRVVIRRRE